MQQACHDACQACKISKTLPAYSPVSVDALVLPTDGPPVAACMSETIHNGMPQEAAPLQCRKGWRGPQCEREEPLRQVHPRAQPSMCTYPETSGTNIMDWCCRRRQRFNAESDGEDYSESEKSRSARSTPERSSYEERQARSDSDDDSGRRRYRDSDSDDDGGQFQVSTTRANYPFHYLTYNHCKYQSPCAL